MSIVLNAFKYYVQSVIKYIMALTYIDDTSVYGAYRDVKKAIKVLNREFKNCNLTINEEKSSKEPATKITWLGFEISPGLIMMSEDRRRRLKQLHASFMTTHPHLWVYLKLVGRIHFFSNVVPGVKGLVRQLSASIPQEYNDKKHSFLKVRPE
jgi:hypothetical protein